MVTKMKFRLFLPLAACLIFSGCISNRSPVSLPATSNRTTFGEGATLGVSTMAGAATGYALRNDALGAAAGAGVGLVTGAVINNVSSSQREQREAELIESARREERTKMQQDYWEAERMEAKSASRGTISTGSRNISYAGGYFEGVNVAPRKGDTSATLEEPKRP